jgi:hypothetical protein
MMTWPSIRHGLYSAAPVKDEPVDGPMTKILHLRVFLARRTRVVRIPMSTLRVF